MDLLQYYNTIEKPRADHRQSVSVEADLDLQKILKLVSLGNFLNQIDLELFLIVLLLYSVFDILKE